MQQARRWLCIAMGACLAVWVAPSALTAQQTAETTGEQAAGTLGWLSGCWRTGTEDAWTEEVWSTEVGGVLLGYSRSVRGGAVRGTEFLRLHLADEEWVYVASPSGQSTTSFNATEVSGQQLDVRNPSHDFPQRIHYQRRAADHVFVSVYGAVADQTPAFELDFRRVACGP